MKVPIVSLLGLVFALSEAGLSYFKRAKVGEAADVDRGSLRWLWAVIVASVFAAYVLAGTLPSLRFGRGTAVFAAGLGLLAAGLALRWWSIVHLGRFFTVNVAIASDHRLIDTGPYRFIRHPSYTGVLMAFLGLGLCLGNWASLAVIFIPTVLVFFRRIRVEEAALSAGLGDGYRAYMRRTKRLIPAIY